MFVPGSVQHGHGGRWPAARRFVVLPDWLGGLPIVFVPGSVLVMEDAGQWSRFFPSYTSSLHATGFINHCHVASFRWFLQ